MTPLLDKNHIAEIEYDIRPLLYKCVTIPAYAYKDGKATDHGVVIYVAISAFPGRNLEQDNLFNEVIEKLKV